MGVRRRPRCSIVEKEASRFAQEHGISLVSVCPHVVVGASPARKNHTSIPANLSLLTGERGPGHQAVFSVLKAIERDTDCVPLVHVDHLCRFSEVAAAGRYVCCSLNTTIVDLARFLARKYPQYNMNTDNGFQPFRAVKSHTPVCTVALNTDERSFACALPARTLDEIYVGFVEYGKALGLLPN
ncbi:hypothetical protein U9M48_033295 [Paspalum notatum var. saurae]|uniref:Uncharacterized protein n=1 Tax=Paspalum notatum var. saurae TaxID=547442 RepID=A0AAQ3U6K5_PASNO